VESGITEGRAGVEGMGEAGVKGFVEGASEALAKNVF
jgi:hypothetical protein